MIPNQQDKKPLLKYLLIINIILAICLLLSYLSIYIDPSKFWILSLFGLAYPFILVGNLIFVLIWLAAKKSYLFLSLITILLGINLLGKIVQFNLNQTDSTASNTITLLSYNVHNFSHESKSGIFNKEIQQKTFDFIESQNADIVCLQEFNYVGENIYASHAQLKERLGSDNYYFESYFNPKKSKVIGMATFSKHPIIDKGIFELAETRKFGTFIDILQQNDTLRVYNIHLESISLKEEDYAFVNSIRISDSTQKSITGLILKKLKKALINRTKQVHIIKAHIANSPYPVIVCGDFNELPTSYNYRKVAAGLKDAFIENGLGLGKTFSGYIPAFRIDYILFDPRLTATYYQEFKIDLSDHYPLKAKLYYN